MKFTAPAAIAAVLLIATACLPAAAQTPSTGPHAASEIVTSGNGEATLSPDRAIVRIGIQTNASTAAQASSRNAEKVKAVVDRLKRMGYQADSLRTVGFGVTPNYDYSSGRRLIDYQAVAFIRLSVSHLDRLGSTIDAVLEAGATDVSNIMFESDEMEEGRAEALGKALASARSDAEAIARSAGGRLGRLLEATTQPGGYPIPMDGAMMRASNTNLPPQDVIVSLMLQARWEFVPNQRR